MKNLVKLQLRNIFHNKFFYVCLILSVALTEVFSFIETILSSTKDVRLVFPEIINSLTSEVGIIGMIFITLLCTFDFSEGTTKNIVGRGYSKIKLLLSKYIAALTGLFIMYGIQIILIFILFAKNGLGFDSNVPITLLFIIFKIVAFTIFYATIAFVLEKTSSAIITNLFLPNIATIVFGIVDKNLHMNISKYWIENVGLDFISTPALSNLAFPIIVYFIYVVLFAFIGCYITKGKEIK